MGIVKHGDTGKRLYNIWSTMKQRCKNPNTINYSIYGKKGIKVCDEWEKDYNAFKFWAMNNGYSEEMTLDRIDGSKNYEPSNCRWVKWDVQQNNRNNNHIIEFNGEVHTLSQWARIVNVSPKTLSRRIVDKHWSIEKALTTPLMENYRRRKNGNEI